MGDFKWFNEVFKISMINLLAWFYLFFTHFWSQFLTDFKVTPSNWSLGPPVQQYEGIMSLRGL